MLRKSPVTALLFWSLLGGLSEDVAGRPNLNFSMKLGGLTSIDFGADDCMVARAWILLR
jgi:hypothetical protein